MQMTEKTDAASLRHSALNPGCSHWAPIVRPLAEAHEEKPAPPFDAGLSEARPSKPDADQPERVR
jgi:hypothetical protein